MSYTPLTLCISGGVPLSGTVRIPAAKNGVLPLMAASLLCDETVVLHRVPRLSDVDCCLAIRTFLGLPGHFEAEDLTLFPGQLTGSILPDGPVREMRASVLFLAPLLARTGRAELCLPGGCRLGPRPVDLHIDILVRMGAKMRWDGAHLCFAAPAGLKGVDYTLRFPSVGATETLLLAAALAQGTTVLRGAACEPEIVDLAALLNACGAHIAGAGSPVIVVYGVKRLGGAAHTPLPDRIAAATLACAAACAGGEICLTECDPFAFAPVLAVLKQAGCRIELSGRGEVTVGRSGPLSGVGRVFTGVYPAFPTDAAPLLAAALLAARSESSVEDTIFENRFACADGFAAMGAAVSVRGQILSIRPCGALHGARVRAPDLRGGAALAVAALAAPEPTEISDAAYLCRGYEDIAAELRKLGGKAAWKSGE